MKKFLAAILIIVILMINIIPVFAVENSKLTYLYLDKGNITIGDGTVSGYGYFGEKVTTFDEDGYYITQTTTDVVSNTITFDGGKNYVVFCDLRISISSITSRFVCAANVTNSADVTINLEGRNILVSGESRAGIEVAVGSAVTITGEGTLMAGSNGQAGIGGGNSNSSGTVTINSGTILAQSMGYSAGIGGGSAGSNGTLTINGGNVTAIGGETAAGIGGGCTGSGGDIIINGGTVTATGGANAAGIGGGWYGEMGNIIINGGSVKAIAGSGAPAIGAGAGVESDSIRNSDGEVLYLAKFNASSVADIKDIYTDGKPNKLSSYHSNDANFYFYLPAKTHVFSVESDSGLTGFWKATYSSSFTCTKINPFECTNGSRVGADDVIRGLSCGLSDLDDYFTFADGFSFEYTDEIIGTGTKVNLIYNDQPVFTYTALVYGDLNQDGFYDGEDSFIALLMLWEKLTIENTDSIFLEAADVNHSGSIEQEDVDILQQAGLFLQSVPQTEIGAVDTDSVQWMEYTELIEQTVELEETEEPTSSLIDIILSFLEFVIEKVISLIESVSKI